MVPRTVLSLLVLAVACGPDEDGLGDSADLGQREVCDGIDND